MADAPGEPMPVQLLPLASELQGDHCVERVVSRTTAVLAEAGYPVVVADSPEALLSGAPLLVLVVTGGTEHRALEILEQESQPAVLLAHGEHNSLAAALEVLARLRQDSRRGCVVQLEVGDGPDPRLGPVLAALAARFGLHNATLGWVGGASSWLVASSPDPAAVHSRHGCRIEKIAMDEVLELVHSVDEAAAQQVARELGARARSVTAQVSGRLVAAARVYLALRRLAQLHQLDGMSVRCFDLIEATEATACVALGLLNDDGIVAGCEGDLPSLITMLLMAAISGRPAFMANPQAISTSDSSLWLAHCTVATALCEHWSLDSHFETGKGVALAGSLPHSPVTLARLGGADLGHLFAGDGQVVARGASKSRCRTQVQVRLDGGVCELLQRPLGNHLVMAQGHWTEVLECFGELFLSERQTVALWQETKTVPSPFIGSGGRTA